MTVTQAGTGAAGPATRPPVPYSPLSADGAACAVIRSGTSRIMAVLDEQLPTGVDLDEALVDLVLGDDGTGGLGQGHYQGNKVVVVSGGQGAARFGFRFHQIDRASRTVLADLECGNAAAAAGLFALLHGLATPDPAGRLRPVNLGTAQELELTVPTDAFGRTARWQVAFVHASRLVLSSSWFEPFSLAHADGRCVDYWVVERGNVFVLANASPEAAEPELVDELAARGTDLALAMGVEARRAKAPKVILYGVRQPEMPQPEVDAACYFQGELHHSLPGSGAMCLATFLSLSLLDQVQPVETGGWQEFLLTHPSGTLPVGVAWELGDAGPQVVRTQFSTPVRMLLSGTAVNWPGTGSVG